MFATEHVYIASDGHTPEFRSWIRHHSSFFNLAGGEIQYLNRFLKIHYQATVLSLAAMAFGHGLGHSGLIVRLAFRRLAFHSRPKRVWILSESNRILSHFDRILTRSRPISRDEVLATNDVGVIPNCHRTMPDAGGMQFPKVFYLACLRIETLDRLKEFPIRPQSADNKNILAVDDCRGGGSRSEQVIVGGFKQGHIG